MSISVLSLNIEGHRHLATVCKLLARLKPDICNLQEVFLVDVPRLATSVGAEWSEFKVMSIVDQPNPHLTPPLSEMGLLQLGRVSRHSTKHYYYAGSNKHTPFFFDNQNPNSMNRVLQVTTLTDTADKWRVAHTHFTWSEQGSYSQEQQTDWALLQKRLQFLKHDDPNRPFILTGDLNSPRNNENNVYHQLSQNLTSWVPSSVTTTLDHQLHKNGPLNLVVDGFFTSPGLNVTEFKVFSKVSDHTALYAEISTSSNLDR